MHADWLIAICQSKLGDTLSTSLLQRLAFFFLFLFSDKCMEVLLVGLNKYGMSTALMTTMTMIVVTRGGGGRGRGGGQGRGVRD